MAAIKLPSDPKTSLYPHTLIPPDIRFTYQTSSLTAAPFALHYYLTISQNRFSMSKCWIWTAMTESAFQKILSENWNNLGKVIRAHYFLRPFSDDYICVSGVMTEVHHSRFAKLLIPFGLIFGAIVPYRGKNIPIDVHYNANKMNGNIYWNRVFKFSEKKHFHFKSHMEHIGGNEVIEFVRFGVGMKLRVTTEDGALVFRDSGYIWRIFGRDIPIPVNLLFGRAYVEERPVSDNIFSMKMALTHPLFGDLFLYHGQFALRQPCEQA